jgi:hypothetical protein
VVGCCGHSNELQPNEMLFISWPSEGLLASLVLCPVSLVGSASVNCFLQF